MSIREIEDAALSLETPTAPLPSPLEPVPVVDVGPPVPSPRLFPALRAGMRHAWRCRRPLLMVLLAQILLAATVAGPLYSRLRQTLDHQAHASALAGDPDPTIDDRFVGEWSVFADLRRKDGTFFDGLTLAAAWVMLAAWVFGALASAGFVDSADAPPARGRVSCGRFLEGGGRWFGRFLRVGLVFAVAYAVVGRLVFELWAAIAHPVERDAPSQATAWHGARIREATFVVVFLLLRVVADLARARLVVFRRRSAVLAFFRSVATLVRHPLRTLGVAAGAGLLEVAVILACAALLDGVSGGSAWEVLGAFLLFQAAVLARWGSRAALLAAYVHLHHGHAGMPLRDELPKATSGTSEPLAPASIPAVG